MIEINESSSLSSAKAINTISRYTRGYYLMDKELIENDLENYKDMANKTKDKKVKKQYDSVVDYLTRLSKNVNENGNIQAYWTLKNGCFMTAPFRLQSMRWLGLDTTDYILKRDDRTVAVSYKDLWNAMAIQLAHRDLDLDTKEIDLSLSRMGCRIHGIDSIDKLFKCTIDNAYNSAVELKILDTPYCSKSGYIKYRNYFGENIKTNNYREAIDSSLDLITSIIINETLDDLNLTDEVEFIGVFEDRIYYNTSMSTSEINEKLAKNIGIRLFGRLFEVKPIVEIY